MIHRKKASSSLVPIMVITFLSVIIMMVILSKAKSEGIKTVDMAEKLVTDVPGEIHEGEEQKYAEDPTNLKILKVTEMGKTTPLANTPSSFDPTNWAGSDSLVSDSNLFITIYFDKALEAKVIPAGYYTVYTSEKFFVPNKESQWTKPGPDPGFIAVDDTNKVYKNNKPLENGYYYIIRFWIEKQYKGKDGKNWTIDPATATIKFETD